MDVPGEKLLIKLWETIADKGIGSLLKPWQMRRVAVAAVEIDRMALLAHAQTVADAEKIYSGKKLFLSNGVLVDAALSDARTIETQSNSPFSQSNILEIPNRNFYKDAIRKEIGLAKTVAYAEAELAQDKQDPPLSTISDDWLLRWRESAANVSSDELHLLWGKVLAGELKNPGGFSFRTLKFLRNLSQQEAKLIEKIFMFAIAGVIVKINPTSNILPGVTFSEILEIQDLGLISGVDAMGLENTYASLVTASYVNTLVTTDRLILVRNTDTTRTFRLPVYLITNLGKQLLPLGSFNTDEGYMRSIGEIIKNQGFDVELGFYRKISEDQIEPQNMVKL